MRRLHWVSLAFFWVSLAFFAVALVRLWIYGCSRGLWVLFLFGCFFFSAGIAESQTWYGVVNVHNVGTVPWNWVNCPTISLGATEYGCDGNVVHVWGGIASIEGIIQPGQTAPFTFNGIHSDGYGCSGSSSVLSLTVGGNVVTSFTVGNADGSLGDTLENFDVYVDGGTCSASPTNTSPCTTNVGTAYNNSAAWSVYAWLKDGVSGQTGGQSTVAGGGNANLSITVPCADAGNVSVATSIVPGQTTNITWSVQNNTPWTQKYTLTDKNTGQTTSLILPSGASGAVAITIPITDSMNVQGTQNVDMSVYDNMSAGYTDSVYNVGSGLNTNSTITLLGKQNSDALLTNGPILWSSNSTTAATGASTVYDPTVNATLQVGFQKLASDNVLSLAAQNSLLALNSTGRVTTIIVSNSISGLTITNNLYLTSTGLFGNLNFSNANISLNTSNMATESTLQGISNLLGGAYDTNFNGVTNLSGDSDSIGIFTNYNDVIAAYGGSEYAGIQKVGAWFDDTITAVVVPTIDEGGTLGPMTIDFGHGMIMNLNPLQGPTGASNGVADIFAGAKMLIQWLIAVYYLKRCLVDTRWAISVCNQSHGIGKPA
jgi:hypothetical protein